MGYRVELFGISDFLPVQPYGTAVQYSYTVQVYKRIILEEHMLDRKI
jgi:hypothetical protein